MQIHRINPTRRWSDITVFNGIARFVEVPEDASGTIESQVRQVLAQAEQSLTQVGSDRNRVLSVTIYLTDFGNLDAMNAIWDDWFPEGSAPSRACVKAALADPDYQVEMAFVAVAGDRWH
ncbi:MAG: RidA family protein [Thiothrix sp.]|nr:RidA family protein [Thiothrix sp.]